jgi:hypothetical protein
MLELSATPSLFDLAYLSEDSIFYATPPHSPIHYESVTLSDHAGQDNEKELDGYDTLYIFGREVSTCYEMPSIFPIEEAARLTTRPTVSSNDPDATQMSPQDGSIYPGTPWV